MLRLAHPAPSGQPTDPPKRRRGSRAPALTFTAEEVRLVRAALVNTGRLYGGLDVLATAMGVAPEVLYRMKRRRPSGTFAIRLAAAAGTTVEAMLSGKLVGLPAPERPVEAPKGPKDGAS